MATPVAATADGGHPKFDGGFTNGAEKTIIPPGHTKFEGGFLNGGGNMVNPPGHVPELDPGSVGSAALLLVGGTLILIDRRRRELHS